MRVSKLVFKDPDSVEPLEWDWTGWLESGDSIVSHEVLVDGLSLVSTGESAGVVAAVVSGGTEGAVEDVTCRITTANGYTDDRTIRAKVTQR